MNAHRQLTALLLIVASAWTFGAAWYLIVAAIGTWVDRRERERETGETAADDGQ